MLRILLAATATAVVTAGAALAQGSGQNLDATAVALSAGFTPDPYFAEMRVAGGRVDGSIMGDTCWGWIPNSPSFYLTYTAGAGSLTFRSDASIDTTLIILDPQGRRFCDDDGAGYPNAQVRVDAPISGTYQVYVGLYEPLAPNENPPFGVRLYISDSVGGRNDIMSMPINPNVVLPQTPGLRPF